MMAVLLLTKRPAPMIPPIEIIVKWRPLSERLSSFFPGICSLGMDAVISGTFVIGWAYYSASRVAEAPGPSLIDSNKTSCFGSLAMQVSFARVVKPAAVERCE
jgi:hypothetical protein